MLRAIIFATCSIFFFAPTGATADILEVFDEAGGARKVDTASLNGCSMIFDSNGNAFELCKLEKVELRPPQSTRARPGQRPSAEPANYVYKKPNE